MLDGIDNNTSNVDFLGGTAYVVKPPVDAIAEIKVLTSSFGAEYGRAGGAVLSATLKSGLQRVPRQRLGVQPQRQPQGGRVLRERARAQEGPVRLEPVRLHRRRPDREEQDLLLRRLRGQHHPAGPDLAGHGPHRAAARQRLHRLLRPDHAADRHARPRPPGPHGAAGHDLRPRHHAQRGRPARSIRSPAAWPPAPASCATRSPATSSPPAGSIPTRSG